MEKSKLTDEIQKNLQKQRVCAMDFVFFIRQYLHLASTGSFM